MTSTSEVRSAALETREKFIHIKPEPGKILVNVGYLLMRLSNARWRNTVHRVSAPLDSTDTTQWSNKGAKMIPDRYSIAVLGLLTQRRISTLFRAVAILRRPKSGDQSMQASTLRAKEQLCTHKANIDTERSM